jgi:NAD(P)-dependent dehydrogenase (short-subunit alcohol dehydrogenase family)
MTSESPGHHAGNMAASFNPSSRSHHHQAEVEGAVGPRGANAGVDVVGTVVDTTVEDWNRVVATNLSGVFFALKYSVPRMLRAEAERS